MDARLNADLARALEAISRADNAFLRMPGDTTPTPLEAAQAEAIAFLKAHGPALLTGQGEDGRDAEYEGYGQACAKARDQWFDSDHGKRCMQGSADGKYLRNRLESAFIAGYSLGHHKGYRDNHAIDAAIQASGSGAG